MKKWHLLVVDDEPLNLEIIAEFLDDPRFDLDLVLNAERALEKLKAPEMEYDLVVLDRMMPGMDGIELLRLIKADPRLHSIPVIMQTAASSPEQIREGIEAGAYYYLTKPYEPRALLAIIQAALEDIEGRTKPVSTEDRTRHQADALLLLTRAEFQFTSLDEAHHLVELLASICPAPDVVALGLTELLVNAVEHGNLGITYAEKLRLKLADQWEIEVARRMGLPEFRDRFATACVERNASEIRFTITDQGQGFSWQTYLELDPARAFDPNGRGIAMARQISFSRLEYRGCGNVVVASVASPAHQSDSSVTIKPD